MTSKSGLISEGDCFNQCTGKALVYNSPAPVGVGGKISVDSS